MPSELTPKQQKVLEYLQNHKTETGRTPSLREAAAELGISHASVAQFIRILVSKGFLQRKGNYSHEIHLPELAGPPAASRNWRRIPIVGEIAAGLPLYAQKEWGGGVVVDGTVFKGRHLFALRVKGDSMIAAGIFERDLVFCQPRQYTRNGKIVVALINHEETTVKRVFLAQGPRRAAARERPLPADEVRLSRSADPGQGDRRAARPRSDRLEGWV